MDKTPQEMTPVEVDTILADLYFRTWAAAEDRRIAADALHHAVGDSRTRSYGLRGEWTMTTEQAVSAAEATLADESTPSWKRTGPEKALAQYVKRTEAYQALVAETKVYDSEYARRPWTRAFVVLNNNGHVHSSMACSTCYSTTRFGWLVDLSGQDEAAIVAAIGADACTVCYPTAPVETAGPRTAFSREEKADREAQARLAAEKAAKLEAKVAKSLSLDGSTVTVTWEYQARNYRTGEPVTRRGRKEIKTLRAAELWYVEAAAGRSYDNPTPEAIAQVLGLIATKLGTTPEAEADRLAAKVERKRSPR